MGQWVERLLPKPRARAQIPGESQVGHHCLRPPRTIAYRSRASQLDLKKMFFSFVSLTTIISFDVVFLSFFLAKINPLQR